MSNRMKLAMGAVVVALTLGIVVPSVAGTSHGNTEKSAAGGSTVPGSGTAGAPGAVGGGTGVGIASPGVIVGKPVQVPPGRYIGSPNIPCPVRGNFPCGPFVIPEPGNANTVTVTGTGTVNAQPDEAVIGLGVQTAASDASDALRENATRMAAVIKALEDLGISKDDITTSSVSLYPSYNGTGGPNGYQADNEISVTLHDLSKVGKAIDDAVAAGANLTNGLTFQLSDQNQGLTKALADAVGNAKTKADALATAAGAKLGPVVSITESTDGFPVPYAQANAGGAAAPTPVNPPMVQTSVSVTVVWSLQT